MPLSPREYSERDRRKIRRALRAVAEFEATMAVLWGLYLGLLERLVGLETAFEAVREDAPRLRGAAAQAMARAEAQARVQADHAPYTETPVADLVMAHIVRVHERHGTARKTAAILKVSEATVRNYLHRAREGRGS